MSHCAYLLCDNQANCSDLKNISNKSSQETTYFHQGEHGLDRDYFQNLMETSLSKDTSVIKFSLKIRSLSSQI